MLRRIPCDQVKAGMYIHGFGGSWFKHPFWRARFVLASSEDVERVRTSGVPYVTIDDERGIGPDTTPAPDATQAAKTPQAAAKSPSRKLTAWASDPDIAAPSRRETDKAKATALVRQAKNQMKSVFYAARLGRAVRCAEVEPIVDGVIDSIEENAQALLGVIRLKRKDEYTYFHSVAVCTLMVNLARYIGLDEPEIRDFGLAGLLHDIGKMGIDDEILNKPGRLTDEEFEKVRAHPAHGHALLSETPDMAEAVLDVCLHHHEKIDGTGYPFALPEQAITLAARAGAICDVYDALTSDRAYKAGWTPVEAISAMASWEGHFDPKLLFQFMQSIGVFPQGLLVSLRSNRLGLTLDNRRRSSRPRVCAFYSTRERCFLTPETVVIRDTLAGDQIIGQEDPRVWGFTAWDEMAALLAKGADSSCLVAIHHWHNIGHRRLWP